MQARFTQYIQLFSFFLAVESKCPVSSQLNPVLNGVHSYPVDIINQKASAPFDHIHYNCSAKEGSIAHHDCSSVSQFCPLLQDVKDLSSRKMSEWTSLHSFCAMRNAIRNYEPVKIVVLGGSLTAGAGAAGCCCDLSLDAKCPLFKESDDYDYICGQMKDGFASNACRWSGYFERWIKSMAIGNIEVINLARGGATSAYM